MRRALEIYRRVDRVTNNCRWVDPTTEEQWHYHAEKVLMVALRTTNIPPEAWRCAKLLRAIPNCRLVLMAPHHIVSPSLSTEEASLMSYLHSPPHPPTVNQATTGLQNWKHGGRRLVQIGGRLQTANQLHQSFVKILSKHLAANKKVSFAFQQKSSMMMIMNPSPTDIVELFTFVEVTLVQYATVAGHLPGVAAAAAKLRQKKVNEVEVAQEEPPKEDAQARAKDLTGMHHCQALQRTFLGQQRTSLLGKVLEKVRKVSPKNDTSSASLSSEEAAKRATEHRVDADGSLCWWDLSSCKGVMKL